VAATAVAVVLAVGAGGAVGGYLALHRPVSLGDLMGLSPLPARRAPGFALTDQRGARVSLASFRGRVVVLNFFDDRCTDLCPVVSQELVDASHDLGRAAGDVAFVAVNVNAAHEAVHWVRSFSTENGLDRLPHWYFLTGTTAQLEGVWRDYQIEVQLASNGNVLHTSPMYFLDARGTERAVASPDAYTRPDGTGYLPAGQLRDWGHGIAEEVRSLLVARGGTGR
jgi:cytochrome oxidase Cu insertion factor (SCO1/SenC/PrrC family)